MKPYHVIGFKAVASAGYDCSFMISFPADAQVTPDQIHNVCQNAIRDAHGMHNGVKIMGRVEKTIIMQ